MLDGGEEWISSVEMVRRVMEILGWRSNVANGKFKNFEDFTLEKTKPIHKKLEVHQREVIISLEGRLIER